MKSDDKNLTSSYAAAFEEIIAIIDHFCENAFRAVNRELVSMYWEVGNYISEKVKHGGWGKAIVQEFSLFIQVKHLDIKGFSPSRFCSHDCFLHIVKKFDLCD
jgi:hypothetical protein